MCGRICSVNTASGNWYGIQLEDLINVGKIETFKTQHRKDGI
jgi:hypothetical protein